MGAGWRQEKWGEMATSVRASIIKKEKEKKQERKFKNNDKNLS